MTTQIQPNMLLHGFWLWLARLGWLTVFLLVAGIFIEIIPYSYRLTYNQVMAQTNSAVIKVMPFDIYVRCLVVLEFLVSTVYIFTAIIIFWYKSNDWMAIFVSITLLHLSWFIFGINGDVAPFDYTPFIRAMAPWLPDVLFYLTLYSFMLLFFIFPNGHFVPGWMKWGAGTIALWFIVLWSDPLHSAIANWFALPEDWAWLVVTRGVPGAIILGLGGQTYRYWRVSNAIERQQSKWVLLGLAAPFLHLILFSYVFGQTAVEFAIDIPLSLLISLSIPLTIGFSIFRYRLWDIDLIINRTLVYGTLTTVVVVLYGLSVGTLGTLAQTQNSLAISLLAVVVAGSMGLPLRSRLQALVNRYLPVESQQNNRSAIGSTNTAPLQLPLVNVAQSEKRPQAMRNPQWKFLTFFGFYTLVAVLWLLLGLLPQIVAAQPSLRQAMNNLHTWPFLEHVLHGIIITSFYSVPLYLLLFQYLFSLLNVVLGVTLVRLRPSDRVARLLALGMVGTAAIFNLQAHTVLGLAASLLLNDIHELLHLFAGATYLLALLLFPTGTLPPWPFRPWRLSSEELWFLRLLLILIAVVFGSIFTSVLHGEEPADFVAFFGVLVPVVGVTAQFFRYRRATTAQERQQCKTLILSLSLGFALAIVIGLLTLLLSAPPFRPSQQTIWALERSAFMIFPLLFTMIPISLSVIILRYRLWDLDLIINRSLVYGLLTSVVVILYGLAVGVLGRAFQGQGNGLLAVLATGVIAILFHPLHQQLRRTVNRLMYGDRDDPATVIARLGQRLEATVAPDAMLSTIVETVMQALKLPYVAIILHPNSGNQPPGMTASSACHPAANAVVIDYGRPNTDLVHYPLVFQGLSIGELQVARRARGEEFSPADHLLLENLARQAGAAVNAIQLTTALQHSRQQLVNTREEERRRLRRDLHDGLGPQLASQTLTIDAITKLLHRDPGKAAVLLQDLKRQSQDAIRDIRRLVYELRPPALDDLGLVEALREYANQHQQSGLQINFDTPQTLPPLPAAVEVAVYRIVQEALTNVVRHAQAHHCNVNLIFGIENLRIEIYDDGHGLPQVWRAGIGMHSMRERATELGGSCVIEPAKSGGVCVKVVLPLVGVTGLTGNALESYA